MVQKYSLSKLKFCLNEFFFTDYVGYYVQTRNRVKLSGFDLTTHDSYFMIQVEDFTNHILAENVNFMNHREITRIWS